MTQQLDKTLASVLKNNKYFTELVKTGKDMTVCGPGSTLQATRHIVRELPFILQKYNITSILDLPCGDFNWMRTVNLGSTSYIGADLNPTMVQINQQKYPGVDFRVMDILNDDLPKVDLVFCRDLFPHLPFADIKQALENIKRSGSKYLLCSTFSWKFAPPTDVQRITEESKGIAWRRLNLFMEPFNMPPCLDFIIEFNQERDNVNIGFGDKMLALWDCNSF